MKMATVIRDVFVLVGFVLANTTANAQESASPETHQFEQLQSEESAAAVEAAKIRELKTSGVEPDSDRLSELERKLNTHLDAAFELKLQLEERQVKTLQNRLSQLESQIGQRKQLRDKIIARRSAELIDGEVLEWSSQNSLTESKNVRNDTRDSIPVVGSEGAVPPSKSPIEELRTPEQFRADLEPLLQNVKSCEQRLRTQEAAYYKDKSNAVELQAAWDALVQADADLKSGAVPIDNAIRVVSEQRGIAKEVSVALHNEQVVRLSTLAKGAATEAELEAAMKAIISSEEILRPLAEKLKLLEDLRKSIPRRQDVAKFARDRHSANELSPSTDDHDPVDALIWLGAGFDAKLEFITFDNLNLPIKAALRVHESTGKYQSGDLIFGIKGYTFETFDQAVAVATNHHSEMTYFLRGGLGGDVASNDFMGELNQLVHSASRGLTVSLEVPLVSPESGETRIHYLQGICVSLDGLVVVPSLLTSIEKGKAIKLYGELRGTASVVATDELHKLTLLKLDISDKKLFPWAKCLTSIPSRGQRMWIIDNSNPISATVSTINQDYSSLPECHDAFTLNEYYNAQVGARLMSFDGELHGILLEISQSAPQPDKTSPHACLPAVHIEALRAKYRVTNPQP